MFGVIFWLFQISSRTWGINYDTIACVFELVDGPPKICWKTIFLEAVYQLKNTSDCIQIDPPGPGRNLKKKSKKKVKKEIPKILSIFVVFLLQKFAVFL